MITECVHEYSGEDICINISEQDLPPMNDDHLGDLNGDNISNILDVVLLINCIISTGGNCNDEYGDGNEDGHVDVLDIVTLVNYLRQDSLGAQSLTFSNPSGESIVVTTVNGCSFVEDMCGTLGG